MRIFEYFYALELALLHLLCNYFLQLKIGPEQTILVQNPASHQFSHQAQLI